MSEIRYDVALSFAGEDRAKAEELAQLLREGGVRVFYDKFEQARLWGSDLSEVLHRVTTQIRHNATGDIAIARTGAADSIPNGKPLGGGPVMRDVRHTREIP
jgi:hypothetical protein